MRDAQEIAYQLLGMALIMTLLFVQKQHVRLTKVSLCLGIFGLWTICLYALGKCTIGFNYLFNIFIFIGVYFATISCYKVTDFKFIRKCILWVFAINTIYIVCQAWGFDPVGFTNSGIGGSPQNTGLLGLPAHYGVYTAIAICMFSAYAPFSAILLFGFLSIGQSSGAIGAAVIAYLYILWVRRHEVRFGIPYIVLSKIKPYMNIRKILIPYFFLAVMIVSSCASWYIMKVDLPMGMFTSRPPAWKLMINDAFKHPLWGWGLGAIRQGTLLYVKDAGSDATVRATRLEDGRFQIVESEAKAHNLPPEMRVDIWDNCHNEYINLLYHFSIIGVILFGFLIHFMYLRIKQTIMTKELASIIGVLMVFLLSSITQFPFSVARLACIVPVMLGMLVIHTQKD